MPSADEHTEQWLAGLPGLSAVALAQPATFGRLCDAISWLIAFAPNKLHRLFIKVDLAEKQAYGILLNTPATEVPAVLARAILDRLRQKWESRQQPGMGPAFAESDEERW